MVKIGELMRPPSAIFLSIIKLSKAAVKNIFLDINISIAKLVRSLKKNLLQSKKGFLHWNK